MKTKCIAWILMCTILFADAAVPNFAKGRKQTDADVAPQQLEQPQMPEKKKRKMIKKELVLSAQVPEVTEASDLMTLAEAAAEADTVAYSKERGSEADFFSKRLLVKSESVFDPMGAVSVIAGYGQLYVLDYASQADAKAAYENLQKLPQITVEPDVFYGQTVTAEMPEQETDAGNQSGENSNAGIPADKKDILVAILDTGYEDAGGKNARMADGVDLLGGGMGSDSNGHGTAMANLILDNTPDCVRVMPVRAADSSGSASVLTLYMGIHAAIERKADLIVISMSSYKPANSELLGEAIQKALEAGILTVVSAGNAGRGIDGFSPANIGEAVTVSAVTKEQTLAGYSNYGDGVDFCSYGASSYAGPNGEAVRREGTSVAAALAAAAIAETMAVRPDCSREALLSLLKENAKDLGEAGRDPLYGDGLLLPKRLRDTNLGADGQDKRGEDGRQPSLLFCDWRNMPRGELDELIGKASNMERRIFLDQLGAAEEALLLSMDTMFSRHIIYSENKFNADGSTQETFRQEGTLYQIVKNQPFDTFEIQAQTYHIFAYGTNQGTIRSCIKVDTSANNKNAIVYCWMKDRSTDQQNTGAYGLTFDAGQSAFNFSGCTSGIENTDTADSGNPVVWRLKIRGVQAAKPENMAVDFNTDAWNKDTYQRVGNVESGYGRHYWYIFHYQVKPASGAARQSAYGSGRYHGGFWDLKDASGKTCGSGTVTTTLDIGTRDLYTDANRDGITYRLPFVTHSPMGSITNIADRAATCLQTGAFHAESAYYCSPCSYGWKITGPVQETARLSHAFWERRADDSGLANGKRWEECARGCGGYDVNGVYWQKNVQYLHPIRYWEMNTDGTYNAQPSGIDWMTNYCAAGTVMPEWSRQPSNEFVRASLSGVAVPANAAYHDVYIRRKEYRIRYDGNGTQEGHTVSQHVYCGETVSLNQNSFLRAGYDFKGWSLEPKGDVIPNRNVKNLSLIDRDTVMLYAQWKPGIYRILLNNQGANRAAGTNAFYERYSNGYYMDLEARQRFESNKIKIPQKEIADAGLAGGWRKQYFRGYYTRRNGNGYQAVQADGTLAAKINSSPNYSFFQADDVVYANWENMYAIQFDPNLSSWDRQILQGCNVACPRTGWKVQGEDTIVTYEKAVVEDAQKADIFRFLGWSLTPKVQSADEIILSPELHSYTFSADQDITLYAQWDRSFGVAYVGNVQTNGTDFLDLSGDGAGECDLRRNPFEKEVDRPAVDVESGRTVDESGEPYLEKVKCRFMGWSMEKDKDRQKTSYLFKARRTFMGAFLLFKAQELAERGDGYGLTYGMPMPDYSGSPVPDGLGARMPFITLFAIWDEYPQIQAADLYLPLSDAQSGILTEEYLLNMAAASDDELKSPENPQGKIANGEDAANGTSFSIPDYQAEDFTGAEQEMSISITYKAVDAVGNATEKMIAVHLADTSGSAYDAGGVRFISAEYLDTLKEDSVWRTGEYADQLAAVLNNGKSGEEYTEVTPVQRVFGMKPVRKPGSGTWDRVQEVWKFTREDVLAVQNYLRTAGADADADAFFETFARCKVQ